MKTFKLFDFKNSLKITVFIARENHSNEHKDRNPIKHKMNSF